MTEPHGDKRFALKFRQWEKVSEGMQLAERGQPIWCRLRRREAELHDVHEEADLLAEELGLNKLGEKWAEIDGYTAENILMRMLGRSLVTEFLLMEPIEARATAEHLLDTFQMPRTYLTNVISYDDDGLTAWTPLTKQTFDAGLVIIDEQWAGMIAVAEAN